MPGSRPAIGLPFLSYHFGSPVSGSKSAGSSVGIARVMNVTKRFASRCRSITASSKSPDDRMRTSIADSSLAPRICPGRLGSNIWRISLAGTRISMSGVTFTFGSCGCSRCIQYATRRPYLLNSMPWRISLPMGMPCQAVASKNGQ
jgi:hypothetical protein